jgi:tetratricopeptide (TPR) repeat protein
MIKFSAFFLLLFCSVSTSFLSAEEINSQSNYGLSKKILREQIDSSKVLIEKWNKAGEKEKEIRALKETGAIYQRLNTFDSAAVYYQKAAELAMKGGYKELYSSVVYNLGIVYSNMGLFPEAIENGMKALETDRGIGKPENIAASLNGIAVIYQRWGKYDKALEYQLQSIKISEETANKPEMAYGYYNLGIIFNKLDKPDQSLEYFNMALNQCQQLIESNSSNIQHQQLLSEIYFSIGGIYLNKGDLNLAQAEYNKAIEIKTLINDLSGLSNLYQQQGAIFEKQRMYKPAIACFSNSLQITQKLNDIKGMAIVNFNIGNLHYMQADYKKAEEFLNKSIEVALSIGEKEVLKQAYLFLSNINEAKNNTKQALVYHKLYKAYADSVFNDNTSKVVEELSIKFETEKKEKENQILQLTVQKQKNFGFFLVGIIVLVITILVVIYILYRSKQKTNKIISYKNQLLGEQNAQISSQKILIEQKNRDLTDSIVYAQRIQESLLADAKTLNRVLPEAFIFLKPKDIVSGDFYWFSGENGKFILSAVDCTGHGVPGAFMSMLGSSFLDQIVNNKGITSPDLILNELSSNVQSALKQSETKNQDGMDMALCSIDFISKTVEYAGAKNPLVYIKNNELFKIKADKYPIGRSTFEATAFTRQTIVADTPTCFYMFSDGYADQFGGPENKKFMSKKMCELFLENHQKPFDEQKSIIENTIIQWMDGKEQIDDILVIGFKVG